MSTRKSRSPTTNNRSKSRSKSRSRSKSQEGKYYSIFQYLVDHDIPSEIAGEISKNLNKKDRITLGKTNWHTRFPPIEFLYDFEEKIRGNPYPEYESYELTNVQMTGAVTEKLKKCIKDHIMDNLAKKSNRYLKILPTDIEKIQVEIHLGDKKNKDGSTADQLQRSPDQSDSIVINSTRANCDYSVNFGSISVITKPAILDFPDVYSKNCVKQQKIKLYAHLK